MFTAIDGETIDDQYFLLAASTGEYLLDDGYLDTTDCLDFLLGLDGVIVCFGLNYDVNMMLHQMDEMSLRRLWVRKRVDWQGYFLEWIPRKWLRIRHGGRQVTVHEVWGFFQSSFVKALDDFKIAAPVAIADMKSKRDSFARSQEDEIVSYCLGECRLLVKLMGALKGTIDGAGLRVNRWIGPGAIAAAMLTDNRVKPHHAHDNTFAAEVEEAIRGAYFGGRVELFLQGELENCVSYDIASAYPFTATQLPAIDDVQWYPTTDVVPHGVYLVRWRLRRGCRFAPFPYRHGKEIYYLNHGLGWHHGAEIIPHLHRQDIQIIIEAGYAFHDDGRRPFRFLAGMFVRRQVLKRTGDRAHYALKLALNSVYGKLAQGIGYKNRLPRFQSYYWAGSITARTRALVATMALRDLDALAMIATDGVFFTRSQDVNLSDELGGWERNDLGAAFLAQPGVYVCEGTIKTRGFMPHEINWTDLRQRWQDTGPATTVSYPSRRFVGLGDATNRNDLTVWRKWTDSQRDLYLLPQRKDVDWNHDSDPYRHLPMEGYGDRLSDIYKPRHLETSHARREDADQPH